MATSERKVEIATPDGVAEAWVSHPSDGRAHPGVIVYTDAFGVRPTFHEMARRLASNGFTVLMPNIFYREKRVPVFERMPNFADEKERAGIMSLIGTVTPARVRMDAPAYAGFLAGLPETKRGTMGAVGYCMGGGIAIRTAATLSDQIDAAASFHGGRLATADPESPHLLAPQITARLYFGHASNDQSMTPEMILLLEQALIKDCARYESEMYEGALHGWTVPDSPVYNVAQAERHWTKLIALFKDTL